MANILVTGANRGIGLELVKEALRKGHCVFALVRDLGRADDLMNLKAKYESDLSIFKCDVSSIEDLHAVREELSGQVVDVLINNAGICMAADSGPFEDLNCDTMEGTFSVNTMAPLKVTQTFLPLLKKSAQAKLINMSSNLGSIANVDMAFRYAYRMSKTALNMFTKVFSVDFPGITVLSIHPGWVKTDMGGAEAPQQPLESAQGIINVIEKAQTEQSGGFYDYQGNELPW